MIKRVKSTYDYHLKSRRQKEKIIIKQTALRCVVYAIQQIKKQQVNQINNGLVFIINFDEILEKIKRQDLSITVKIKIFIKFRNYIKQLGYEIDTAAKYLNFYDVKIILTCKKKSKLQRILYQIFN